MTDLPKIGTLRKLGRPPGIVETKPRRHVTGPAMVRRTIPLPPVLLAEMQAEARDAGVSLAEIVRRRCYAITVGRTSS